MRPITALNLALIAAAFAVALAPARSPAQPASAPPSTDHCEAGAAAGDHAPKLTVTIKPPANGVAAIHVEAKDPDGDKLSYAFTTTGGRIGKGPTPADAIWDLGGLRAGVYLAMVTVDDGRGCSGAVNTTLIVP